MASKTGLVAQPDSPLYCATKGAAVHLARALALDWAAEGVRVNAVCPGIVDTPMLDSFLRQLDDPDRARRELSTAQPLGRLARPAECAAAALFLVSPEAAFITGWRCPSTEYSPRNDRRSARTTRSRAPAKLHSLMLELVS
jgi:NAD(P)-dependent dehydrogenase (short-subunit alcohol dehydrogenase family)